MSTQPNTTTEAPSGTRVLEISDLPLSQVRGYAADADGAYFERRGDRTFLVTE